MKSILSRAGRGALARLPAATLFAFDFDGTLAPIVSRPERARIPPRTAAELRRLARLARVAIVSGRRRDELTRRLPPTIRPIIGNHGNEGLPGTSCDRRRCAEACRAWQESLSRHFNGDRRFTGASIENKTVTLALHIRGLTDYAAVADELGALLATLSPPPRIVAGPCVFNLIPAGALEKPAVFAPLLRRTKTHGVLYVGDDDSDEQVFRGAPPHWITVRIGHPQRSAARFNLRAVDQMASLLRLINRKLKTPPAGPRSR